MKLSAMSLALAGGVFAAICIALITVASKLGIPGAHQVTNGIRAMLGSYGYSVSWLGLLMGIIIGFVKGFVVFGLFAILYNSMVKK